MSKISEETQPTSIFEQFKQQMFRAWLPIPSLTKTITLFFVISAIFIVIGVPMIILSNQIVQITIDYDNVCQNNCTLLFTVPEKIQAPVFLYYQLQDYYQNHRMYANSVSQKQLVADTVSLSEVQDVCQPIVRNSDLYVNTSIDGTLLDPKAPANPCGLIAYSRFNDSYIILFPNGTIVPLSTDQIAWPSDIAKYKTTNTSIQWADVTDPRFMNWMRISSLPDFRKLWARINVDLPAGQYSVLITNNYNVQQFGASKYLILSTSNFFGSKNRFLSIMYLIMGGICFVIGVAFVIRKLKMKKKEKK